MQIFFSVGEPSGDQHAAHLIEELRRRRPDLECVGFGGPLMQRAGCQLHYPLTNLAVMGLVRVLPLLWTFYKLVRQAARVFRESPPDVVVLVDFPGFNWWIARKARSAGIPVIYYLPPQLWAWAPWRIRRMRKYVDHVLCGLSFEQQWYAERGVPAEFVGHPFFDEVAGHRLDEEFAAAWSSEREFNIGILPGSRNQEVARNFPVMLEIAQQIAAKHRHVRFLVACYREGHRDYCSRELQSRGGNLPVHLFVGKTPEIIELSQCCLMVSGSVSLEMLARTRPAVVLYCCSWLMYAAARLLLTVNSITLPNLMCGRKVLPEFAFAGRGRRERQIIFGTLSGWISDRHLLELSRQELADVRKQHVHTGATARAAESILGRLPARRLAKAA